jgi:hypothetical protein
MSQIIDRFIQLIESKTSKLNRFKELEEKTSIPAVSWRKAFSRGQRPTVEMIEGISKLWPEYAFWMNTGISDRLHGHLEPGSDEAWYRQYFADEKVTANLKGRIRTAAKDLFAKQIEFNEWLESKTVEVADDDLDQLHYLHEIKDLSEIREQQELTLNRIEHEAKNAFEKKHMEQMARHHDSINEQ